MISNSGSDENGRITGGKPGDQTGNEWNIRTWYNRPWNCILRHPDKKTRDTIADLSKKAANNNNIGYNQANRDSYWKYLVLANYKPEKITTPCDADCSAGVIANTKAAGYILGSPKLRNLTCTYTGNMRNSYINAGFECITGSQYLTSDNYLIPGDILLNDDAHTAVNLDYGSKTVKPLSAGNVITLTMDIPIRKAISTTKKQAPYMKYDELPESTKSKVIKLNGSVKLKKGTKVTVKAVTKNDKGDTWILANKGYYLPVIVNGKVRYK